MKHTRRIRSVLHIAISLWLVLVTCHFAAASTPTDSKSGKEKPGSIAEKLFRDASDCSLPNSFELANSAESFVPVRIVYVSDAATVAVTNYRAVLLTQPLFRKLLGVVISPNAP
jgi:hypothetical protein